MTDAGLLTLTHWLSPVFPVGGYAYSAGLETAIADALVADEEALADWLDHSLAAGAGLTDAVLLTSAMEADADAATLNDWARALSPSAERWQETWEQGQAFTRALADMGSDPGVPVALPVAVGRAARDLGLRPEQVAALYLQAMVANLATGAVRHIPLGQTAGQRIIAGLAPRILDTAAHAVTLTPETCFTASFGAELAAMRHETQETRIFRT
ncbi:urease accessory protein UreF [Alphaproteobacteria bacterium GH1-50]|uniref:Urease accessory protein UreF n=2 Tax=Kangsaoukella pontilimi TaxID=2691042 RepID=A0A7C9IFN9_9RHOB|nr:urease accessory protein UreF [Kangsaoukella pontilimi]